MNKPFKSILEPSAGHGLFFELMPEKFKKDAKLFAVEMDDISCQLLYSLYPGIHLYHGGFEVYQQEAGIFDLIVGNPPYGREILQDEQHADLSHLRIHHYFVAKCMRLLASGGVLAMVLPRYFLDNRRDHARDIIHKEGGSLLAAYRLPDNLFADATVTVDIVFLTKEKGDDTWLHLDKKIIEGKTVVMNRYFTENPSHVIGDLAVIEAYGRPELTCREDSAKDTIKRLIKHLDIFPATKLPTIDAYKLQLINRLDVVETQIKALSALRTQLRQAQCDLQEKEREFVRQCIQTLPVECHI